MKFLPLALSLAAIASPVGAADLGVPIDAGVATAGGVVVVASGSVQAVRPVFARSAPSPLSAFLQPVGAGDRVDVPACLADYSWCRVVTDGLPGWLLGDDLVYVANGKSTPIALAGPALGIPVTAPTAVPH